MEKRLLNIKIQVKKSMLAALIVAFVMATSFPAAALERQTERKEGQTEEQFIYNTRKKGFGPLKQKWWDLPASIKEPIMKELEAKFGLLFEKLKVTDTADIVKKTVTPVLVKKEIDPALLNRLS